MKLIVMGGYYILTFLEKVATVLLYQLLSCLSLKGLFCGVKPEQDEVCQ